MLDDSRDESIEALSNLATLACAQCLVDIQVDCIGDKSCRAIAVNDVDPRTMLAREIFEVTDLAVG